MMKLIIFDSFLAKSIFFFFGQLSEFLCLFNVLFYVYFFFDIHTRGFYEYDFQFWVSKSGVENYFSPQMLLSNQI